MGRKIPGKKHRGVKDPVKQQAVRNAQLKNLINAPPTNLEIQELPKSVLEMNRLREIAKNGQITKRKKKRGKLGTSRFHSSAGPQLPGMTQNDLQFPSLKQKPGESNAAFLNRINFATDEALNEAKLEVKHDVVVNRGKDGTITDVKPKLIKPEDETAVTKKVRNARLRKAESTKDKLYLLKEKNLKKKLKKLNFKEDELEKRVDIVQFGEVVHGPPQLERRPRGCDKADSDRPGKKNLLLTSLLEPPRQSMSDLKRIASARDEAVAAYRAKKARNRLKAS